jgi:hypothetical protein
MPSRDEILAHLDDTLGRYPNVPPDVAHRMVNLESGLNPTARSPKGAYGLMQLMPGTAADLGVDPTDWKQNIEGGVRYLSQNIDRFGGDVQKGVAAYHAGPGAVERAGGIPNTNDGNLSTAEYTRRLTGGAPTPTRGARTVRDDPYASWQPLVPNGEGAPDAQHEPSLWDNLKGSFALGTNMLGKDFREGVRQVLGDDVVASIDGLGDKLGMANLDEQEKRLQASLSPEWQEAAKKDWWDEEHNTFGPAWTDWRSYASGVLQSLPEQVATMFPALRLARAAQGAAIAHVAKGALAKGMDEAAATALADKAGTKALTATATVAGGVLEGLGQAGQSARQVREELAALPDDVWEKSQAYQALKGSLNGDGDAAKRQIIEDQATQAYVTAGAVTSLFGGQGDRVLAKLVAGKLKGSALKRAGQGALAEGALEEFPQSYGSQVAQNIAEQRVDPTIATTHDALNQGLGGAVLGGLQGGAMGAAFGHHESPTDAAPALPVADNSVSDAAPAPEQNAPAAVPEAAAAQPVPEAAAPAGAPAPADLAAQHAAQTAEFEAKKHAAAEASRRERAGMAEGDVGRKSDGLPFANTHAANLALKAKDLAGSHEVAQVNSGFVLRPKAIQESAENLNSAPANSSALEQPEVPDALPAGPEAPGTAGAVVHEEAGAPRADAAAAPADAVAKTAAEEAPAVEGEFIAARTPATMGQEAAEKGQDRTPPAGLSKADQRTWLQGYDDNTHIPPRDEHEGPAVTVDTAAHEAATSPQNELPAPTDAQREAGNYQKGHVRIAGLDISIENPEGSKRRPEWPTLQSHYGYIRGTVGKDKDHVDVFVKPGTPEDFAGTVYVIDQIKHDGVGREFDEHKVMLGFGDRKEARQAYLANFTKGWKGLGEIRGIGMDGFKRWLAEGDTKKPFSPQADAFRTRAVEERPSAETAPERVDAADSPQADPEVTVTALEEESGRPAKVKVKASEALKTINEDLQRARLLLDCLNT